MPVEIIARWAVPLFVGCILLTGLIRRVPVFDEFTAGAAEGLKSCVRVLPSLAAPDDCGGDAAGLRVDGSAG